MFPRVGIHTNNLAVHFTFMQCPFVGLARGDIEPTGHILFEDTGGIPDKGNLFPRLVQSTYLIKSMCELGDRFVVQNYTLICLQ